MFLFCIYKSAIFAIGNSIYHSDALFTYVEDSMPVLLNLLNDSLAKTRIHSTGNPKSEFTLHVFYSFIYRNTIKKLKLQLAT